jgi:hypothetical protein
MLNSPGLRMSYRLANYTGLGWLSGNKLAAFVADENGGVTGYYFENDDHFYSLDLPPLVAELNCSGTNDYNTGTNYTHPSLLPDG